MDEVIERGVGDKPLWRKIVDFPLVALVIAFALFIAAAAVAKLINDQLPPMDKDVAVVIKGAINIALQLLVYKFITRRLGEQPRDDLPLPGSAKGIGSGLLFGFVLFTVIVGVAAAVDVYNVIGRGDTSQLVLATMSMAIMPGFMEELMFRGILFRWIEAFGGSWAALLLTSAFFGASHLMNPNASPIAALGIAVEAGVLLGGAYMLTRNLWLAMGIHAAWNFTQGEIFDIPVSGFDQHGLVTARLSGPELLSGGNFGLEASLIAMVIATAAGVWLVMRAVKAGRLVRPWWVRRRLAKEAVGIETA